MKREASSNQQAHPPIARSQTWGRLRGLVFTAGAVLALSAALCVSWGDQVEMQNGDRYAGQVVSLGTNTVVLKSDVLGTLRLPRAKVAVITLGAVSSTNSTSLRSPTNGEARTPPTGAVDAAPDVSPALHELAASTNLIQQVQKQFLSSAGPEANDKFIELLGGFMSGKLSVDDIRAQAKSAADQLRALKRDSGENAGFAADTYLTILDHFLKETAPSGSASNSAGSLQKPKPQSDKDEN